MAWQRKSAKQYKSAGQPYWRHKANKPKPTPLMQQVGKDAQAA